MKLSVFIDIMTLKVYQKIFKNQYKMIVDYLKSKQQKFADIPEFLKPKNEQFVYKCEKIIMEAIKTNSFWKLYNKALQQI